jgi:hypothetical protein
MPEMSDRSSDTEWREQHGHYQETTENDAV